MAEKIEELVGIEVLKKRVRMGNGAIIGNSDLAAMASWLYNLDERVCKLEEEKVLKFLKRRMEL